ncbi:TPA: hypothetical protein HA235_00990 [Candidatus Woesearchaeota archaeon]|nr:hypothetical protein [Candidatus Woesearchaeota archaeon]HIH31261.1 hypothetical protein [Candidatus Woesearchaeota archaeon]HIH54856.1 hypothetical protein [Candidatus Woesearchaeota archaeon]HIJ01761.1 hypothetical protein [Candidatus Woesearchaeota archaeon]HIJ13524.1 hypothetical protein [Candidatus Woesearchaeota archaeon]
MKKHLTRSEEFDILKLVIDKFLLLSIFLLGYGLFKIVESSDFLSGLAVLIGGVLLMIILTIILVREYEFIKS